MNTNLPNESSLNKDPNFKYPEKFKMPDDYNFDISSNFYKIFGVSFIFKIKLYSN
jgi:hypothetical protein